MRYLLGSLLCFLCLEALAVPVVRTTERQIIFQNGMAEYRFEKGGLYRLQESLYDGKALWVNGFGLTYNLPGDRWYWEEKPSEEYPMGSFTGKVIQKDGVLVLETRREGPVMTLCRSYTLRGESPELEVQVRLEMRGDNRICWLNLFATSAPVAQQYWNLVTRIQQGRAVTRLEHIPSPFVEPGTGSFRVNGNAPCSQQDNLTMACFYDADAGRGAALMQLSDRSRLPLRVGMGKPEATSFYCNVSPYHFSETTDGQGRTFDYLEADYRIVPFAGSPEQLNQTVIPDFVAGMQECHALPKTYDTGVTLKRTNGFALWTELPSQKVYPDSLPPSTQGEGVKIFAAKGEKEGFQLVLRPEEALPKVSVSIAGLPFPTQCFPVGTTRRDSYLGIIGDHPDVLLEQDSVDCAARRAQAFYLKVQVPGNAQPGNYQGTVSVSAQDRALAQIPLALTVWNFSIEKRTLTAAWDFWWRKYGFSDYKGERVKIEGMVVDARGGGRWLEQVKVRFDEQGNLLSADYDAFDQSVQRYTELYKQPLLVFRGFMLGYGHKLRKNLFGSAEEVLTPLWKTKMLNFARDFHQHLRDRNISDRVVMDMFDEPYQDSYDALRQTIALLKGVAPEWRFTYAGSYCWQLKDVIDFWNQGCSIGLRETRRIRTAGGECSYYNPPSYGDNGELVKIRGYYSYLWRENVRYIYQWVINCWAEAGNTGSDAFRCASWVIPSPTGPLSTLRMENTRDGVEDYEYWRLLEQLELNNSALAPQAYSLLQQVRQLTGRTPHDEIHPVISNNPLDYHTLRLKAGQLLNQ